MVLSCIDTVEMVLSYWRDISAGMNKWYSMVMHSIVWHSMQKYWFYSSQCELNHILQMVNLEFNILFI